MFISSDVKQKILGVTTLFVIFTIIGVLLVLDRPQNPDLTVYEAQVQKIFEEAKNQFEDIRNVTLPSDIKLYVYTKQQAIDRWGKDKSSLDTDSVLRQENIYKGLFLMAENDSLDNAATEWISSWMAASVGNEIYVIYENFWPWDMPNAEATLIHELTHVWQAGLPVPNSYDANLAYNALLEGDASYMSDYYRTQHDSNINSKDSAHTDNLFPFMLPWLNSIHPSVSSAFTELNLFPYFQGKTFVATLVDNGGWDRLNLCYTSGYTPCTTAQILHPDKYFFNETVKSTFTPTPADDSWVSIYSNYGRSSDTYGEYFIYVILSRWLGDNQAQKAAAGWGGDSFTYYEKDRDFLFVWNITWDSVQDASEFHQAFIDMLNIIHANPQDDPVWFTNGRYLTVTCDPDTQSTILLCSTNQTAINSLFFK